LYLAIIFSTCGASLEQAVAENRFEPAIRKFEELDRQHPPEKGRVLFVGSSSIRLWNLKKSFPELDAINRGFGGSHISDSIDFAERIVLKYKPRTVLLYAGDNDIAAGKPTDEVVGDFKRFANIVHQALPETRLLFLAIKPSIRRWELVDRMRQANERIEAYTKQHAYLGYVDIFEPMLGADGTPMKSLFIADGLHLNAKGYALWTEIVEPYLVAAERSSKGQPRREGAP